MAALTRKGKIPGPRNWNQGDPSCMSRRGATSQRPRAADPAPAPRRQTRSGHRPHEARSLCPPSQQPPSVGAAGISFRSLLPLRAMLYHEAIPLSSFLASPVPASGESCSPWGAAERKHTACMGLSFFDAPPQPAATPQEGVTLFCLWGFRELRGYSGMREDLRVKVLFLEAGFAADLSHYSRSERFVLLYRGTPRSVVFRVVS